ncbi:MAG: SH3 domain-containing protein [Anaerolineales bacterium]
MNKRLITLILVIPMLLLACNLLSPSSAPTAAEVTEAPVQVATVAPTNTEPAPTIALPTKTLIPTNTLLPSPTLTSTPDFSGLVTGDGVNIRKGPDTVYDVVNSYDKDTLVVVTGKNKDCSWVAIDLPDGKSGWIRADLLEFSVSCSLLSVPAIPPTPTPLPYVPPTATACSGSTVKVTIINNTGGVVYLNLRGPCTYSFYLPTGKSTIDIIPGTYSYTGNGCGGSSLGGSQSLNASTEWTFFCN